MTSGVCTRQTFPNHPIIPLVVVRLIFSAITDRMFLETTGQAIVRDNSVNDD
jgi:hypothetical protein